jgi:hypothetical protein
MGLFPKVNALTRMGAVPICSNILSNFGATVTRNICKGLKAFESDTNLVDGS